MYYSARGPDPEDNSLAVADILKPNLVAPGNSIWSAWSTLGTESVEFEGNLSINILVNLWMLGLYCKIIKL